MQFLSSGRFRGLLIDFEAFPPAGQPGYTALLLDLSADLHAHGMKLYVAVPPHNEEYDYRSISAAAAVGRKRRALNVVTGVPPRLRIVAARRALRSGGRKPLP